MSDKRLRSCPFCGGEALLHKSVFIKCEVTVVCKKCGARTLTYPSVSISDAKMRAINAWNTRKSMDRIVERLEEERDYEDIFEDDSSIGAYNAYLNALKIVKEEGGIDVTP